MRLEKTMLSARARSGGAGSDDRPSPTGAPVSDRQAYEKPLMRTVDLAAEEVLAVGCKLAGGPGGPIGASCTASSCFSAGS